MKILNMKNIDEQFNDRLQNIRWTLSENYDRDLSFSLFPIFQRDYIGSNKLSNNSIIYINALLGCLDRRFDLTFILAYADRLKNEVSEGSSLMQLIAIPLEKAGSDLLLSERPCLKSLRQGFLREVLEVVTRGRMGSGVFIIDRGYVERSLGLVPKIDGMTRRLLDDLIALSDLDTGDFIAGMQKVLKSNFVLSEVESKPENKVKQKNKAANPKNSRKRVDLLSDDELLEELSVGSAEFMDNILLDESEKKFKDRDSDIKKSGSSMKDRLAFIEKNYGPSMLSKKETGAIEEQISLGIHENEKVHISGGFKIEEADIKKALEIIDGKKSYSNDSVYWLTDRSQAIDHELSDLPYRQKLMRRARIDNEVYIREKMRPVKKSINLLTEKLKAAIKNEAEEGRFYKDHGLLKSDIAWKNPILHQDKVFLSSSNEEPGQLIVDLVLDSSASQDPHKERVACQAYILSKALENANIPLRISSFQSQQGYTVIKQFRDYYETNKSREVLNFFPDAANRDGYAFEIVKTRMLRKPHHKNIMIVLSDGKPFDARIGINTHSFDKQKDYKDEAAIKDSAEKVRKIREDNVALFGIFTGNEEDLDAGLKIYGHGFAYIKKIERFAEFVSGLLLDEIKEMTSI